MLSPGPHTIVLASGTANDYAPFRLTAAGPAVLVTGHIPTPVPTLTEWAIILFAMFLAGGAALVIQRRRLVQV